MAQLLRDVDMEEERELQVLLYRVYSDSTRSPPARPHAPTHQPLLYCDSKEQKGIDGGGAGCGAGGLLKC